MKLISIIVPFFNSSLTIKHTLKSISNQSFKDFECILIDDGSFDKSRSIVEEFINNDKRFKLYENPQKGVVSARNYGIKKSKGRFLTFLDSDDLWHPFFLEESISIRKEFKKKIAITHSSYYRFSFSQRKIKSYLIDTPKIINSKNILKKNFLPLLTVLIDREVIEEIYFEDIRPEDYNLWINLIYIKKNLSLSLNKPLGYYRISENQRSKNKIMALQRIYKLFGNLPDSNIINQNFNTINWLFFNSMQRIFNKKEINTKDLNYLNSLLN